LRVGIDYRFLAVGPGLITRGICRFTQQQLREVLAIDHDDEFVLLCNADTDLSLIAPEVRNPENVEIRSYTLPRHFRTAYGDTSDILAIAEHYQSWIAEQGIDVYHCTSPFVPTEPRSVQFDVCPVVSTFYDLIPMLFPEHYYLHEPAHGAEYFRTIEFVKASDRLLAISDAARDDAVRWLGIPRDRVDRAWPIPDDVFQPLPQHMLEKLMLVIGSRIRLPERYVLTVSALHHAKNLETLLRAFALLPARMRAAMPLVVCCYLDPDSEKAVRRLAAELGAADDIVVTGHVSDEELCALYNQATLLAHPSRYEGFGLPVVEAMRCGTPVVTTTASSLPEVAGDAALLVDPEDPAALADAIARLAGDPALQETLTQRGFEQTRRFDAAQLATSTIDSYRRAAAAPKPLGSAGAERGERAQHGDRLRLAVWTPLPPQRSGIADYAAELLEGLAPRCELEVFVDGGYLPDAELMRRHKVHHHSAFVRRAAQRPFDAVVYQVGAFPYHHYMAPALGSHPGIVVLHDLVWSPVVYDRCHRTGDAEGFRRQFAAMHGHRALEELLELERSGGGEALGEFLVRHPMIELVLDGSLAQVVLLPTAADELRGAYPGTDPWLIPMGVSDPYEGKPGMSRQTARCQLGLDQDAFVVGVFGIVHQVKRIDVCLRALAQLAESHPGVRLVVVGRTLGDAYQRELDDLARELGIEEQVQFTGHLPRHLFDAHLVATDVVCNLRTPTHRHMSATVMRGIAAGRPIVATDLEDWRFLPDAFCRLVPCDETEEAALVRTLRELAGDPDARRRMSEAARAFYEREGTVDHMARRYVEVIERVRQRPEPGRLQPMGAPG
jgi:glycosyltransferase involved in cell wall biosynthesis